ncbi:MAG: sigma-70 factor domain-containing protein, partial [Planctomycetaceae bacterium]
MYRVDDKLNSLIARAKERGFVTFHQVDEYLPHEGGDPAMVDHLILATDEVGLDICEDPDIPFETREIERSGNSNGQNTTSASLLGGPEPTSVLSSRDPIRMYLSQMGNIPLLSRAREIFLAKQIEIARKRFRRTLLESDFALGIAVDILEKVHAGELPFERTLRTSETENVRKEQILARMPENLKSLRSLMQKNADDFHAVQNPKTSNREQTAARRRMVLRRRKMASLCEELSVRTHRLQP